MPLTKTEEVLSDLIRVNKDRIEGYEHALSNLGAEDADLKELFGTFIENSNLCIIQLTEMLHKSNTTKHFMGRITAGKIYTTWMEIKAFFTGNERQTILNSCEAIEDATKKAYETALNEPGLPSEVFTLIQVQGNHLQKAHHKVKNLRDA